MYNLLEEKNVGVYKLYKEKDCGIKNKSNNIFYIKFLMLQLLLYINMSTWKIIIGSSSIN